MNEIPKMHRTPLTPKFYPCDICWTTIYTNAVYRCYKCDYCNIIPIKTHQIQKVKVIAVEIHIDQKNTCINYKYTKDIENEKRNVEDDVTCIESRLFATEEEALKDADISNNALGIRRPIKETE